MDAGPPQHRQTRRTRLLASAPLQAAVADLVRIAGCRWKVEECFQSAKNECGLDQYEVRRYVGWYRHITLVMLAHAFLAVLAGQERKKGGTERDTPGLVDLTPAEIRRLLAVGLHRRAPDGDHTMTWSHWRRRHQARARRCRYKQRGHTFVGRPGKDHPTPVPPRYTPHTQAVDQGQ